MADLAEMQRTIAEAAERVGPAVVGLGRGWALGSGVVIEPGQGAHVRPRAARRGGDRGVR